MRTRSHGDADEGEGLADVGPGEFAAGEAPEVAGDGDDEDQLDPLGGLEVGAVPRLIQRLPPRTLVPKSATATRERMPMP